MKRVLVLGDEPEPHVVGVVEHEVAGLRVDRDLVGHAGVVEACASTSAAVLVEEAGLEQGLELAPVLGPQVGDGEPRVVGELGQTERGAQGDPLATSLTAATWIQPSWVS